MISGDRSEHYQMILYYYLCTSTPALVTQAAIEEDQIVDKLSPIESKRQPTAAQPPTTMSLPLFPLAQLNFKHQNEFLTLLRRHSYVILSLEQPIESLSSSSTNFQTTYATCVKELKQFFQHTSVAEREACTSKWVYKNERDVPMWYGGFEHRDIRDAFRVQCAALESIVWPCPSFEHAWTRLMHKSKRICDRALALVGCSECRDSDTLNNYRQYQPDDDEDLSVCYGLYYPNEPQSGQSGRHNVFEHVDKSLFVLEPVSEVEGLEVWDTFHECWIQVESRCRAGSELVLFSGSLLERWTLGDFPGTKHRVMKPPVNSVVPTLERVCFLYEQKYY